MEEDRRGVCLKEKAPVRFFPCQFLLAKQEMRHKVCIKSADMPLGRAWGMCYSVYAQKST